MAHHLDFSLVLFQQPRNEFSSHSICAFIYTSQNPIQKSHKDCSFRSQQRALMSRARVSVRERGRGRKRSNQAMGLRFLDQEQWKQPWFCFCHGPRELESLCLWWALFQFLLVQALLFLFLFSSVFCWVEFGSWTLVSWEEKLGSLFESSPERSELSSLRYSYLSDVGCFSASWSISLHSSWKLTFSPAFSVLGFSTPSVLCCEDNVCFFLRNHPSIVFFTVCNLITWWCVRNSCIPS